MWKNDNMGTGGDDADCSPVLQARQEERRFVRDDVAGPSRRRSKERNIFLTERLEVNPVQHYMRASGPDGREWAGTVGPIGMGQTKIWSRRKKWLKFCLFNIRYRY